MPIPLDTLSSAVASSGAYTITPFTPPSLFLIAWNNIKKFRALLTILFIVSAWTVIRQYLGYTGIDQAMRDFMGAFFLIFGGLKLLNWKNFVISFRAYDPFAKKSAFYAHLYPLIEILLGIAYQFNAPDLLLPNITTIVILSATTYGVAQSLRSNHAVQCACLGGFFNIPISRLTIFENVLMIVMALTMLFMAI